MMAELGLIAAVLVGAIIGIVYAIGQAQQDKTMSGDEVAEREEMRRRIQVMDWYDHHK